MGSAQSTVRVRHTDERITVLDEHGKRVQIKASVRIETARDPDGFVDESKVPEELRAPDGEVLVQDGLRTFVGRQSRKRFTRVDD